VEPVEPVEPVAPETVEAAAPAPVEAAAPAPTEAAPPIADASAEPGSAAPAAAPADVASSGATREVRRPRPAPDKKPRGPDKLSADLFAAGMAKVAARVKLECSRFALRKMAVTVEVVVGADGQVKRAEPTGAQAGSTLGNCVARVVKTAVLEPARTRSTHRHTFTM
jgi:hypothetical protein